MYDLDLLGPAEKHIASEIRKSVAELIKSVDEMKNSLEEIDLDNIENVLLESDRKNGVILCVEPLQNLAKNLGTASLIPLIVKVSLMPREKKSV